jgi:hypothetical protein
MLIIGVRRIAFYAGLGAAALLALEASANAHPAQTGGAARGAQRPLVVGSRSARTSAPNGFEAEFVAANREGEELVWEGRATGASAAVVRIRLTPLLTPAASAEPVWPVRARWMANDARGIPVTAALDGIVDWRRGQLHLGGPVTGGRATGNQVTVDARVRNMDLVGTWSVLAATASR